MALEHLQTTRPGGGSRADILWIALVCYLIHMMEETIYGWLSWTQRVLGLAATWPEFVVVNAFVAVLGIACACIGWRRPWAALVFPALMLTNGLVFHLGAALISGTFSPGMITGMVLFVPVGLLCYRAAALDGVLRRRDIILSAVIGICLMCFPVLLQKTKNLPLFRQPAVVAHAQ